MPSGEVEKIQGVTDERYHLQRHLLAAKNQQISRLTDERDALATLVAELRKQLLNAKIERSTLLSTLIEIGDKACAATVGAVSNVV